MDSKETTNEGRIAYDDALHRAVVAITTSAIEGTFGSAFDETTKQQDAISSSRELNARLKDHLRDLNQRAASLGRTLPTLSAEGKILLHAMFNATDDSWEHGSTNVASVPSAGLKRNASLSLLKNPIGEKEPEDALFHYPALAPSTKSGRSRTNQATWTIEDKESDPLQTQNCYSVVQRIQYPSSTKPSDPSLSSSALSLQSLKRRGEECDLKAHWFWHANLREDERMTPSVVCGCSRSRGIQIKASEDPHRVHGKESIPLTDVKVVTLGMSASAFRDWCARHEAKAVQDKLLNAAAELDETMASSDASLSNRLRVVRRALTVSLKESRRSALFGMWYTDVTIIFDELDGLNSFLASFLLSISYVQWGVNAFDMVESPQVQPPSLVVAIDTAAASGDIKPAERELCSAYHIPPVDFLAIKERTLAPFSPPCMGIEDLFVAAPSLNILQILLVVRFFEQNEWVSLHRLYRRL
ncbi:Hypothetical protein, putative [Bodo saltans]|uniref:Uncharacterized protein n=1 Tax=Bodo saltans TaxID=75058 RepID=A0A0S4IUR9_BODSA|nr:Hypothetical protein, putative [Bodo saltans]|eukprot:CUF96023.1 Hypothetical protein, putative [Bodo saltans]